MPPGFWRIGSTGDWPLVIAVVTEGAAFSISATRICHGDGSFRASGRRGAPPVPGWRRNAIFRPSADQAGEVSRDVEAAMNRIGSPDVYNPMKLWSVRSDTNASVRPSGDHAGDSLVPRA